MKTVFKKMLSNKWRAKHAHVVKKQNQLIIFILIVLLIKKIIATVAKVVEIKLCIKSLFVIGEKNVPMLINKDF